MATEDIDIVSGPTTEPAATAPISSEKSRGSFDVRRKRGGSGTSKSIYLVIGLVIVLFLALIIGIWILAINKMSEGATQVDETKVKGDATLQVDKANDDSMQAAKAEAVKRMQEKEQQEKLERDRAKNSGNSNEAPPAKPTAASSNASQVDRSGTPATPTPLTPAQRKMMGGVVIVPLLQSAAASGATVAGMGTDTRQSSPSPQRDVSESGIGVGSVSRSRGSLSNLSGTAFVPGQATLAPARKYLLTHGTYLRCALYTEIVTDQPGIVDCRLTEPVYSADGSTKLADAGDRLTGEQSVEVKAGQVNVFTSWTEMDTQAGVRARMDSLGAGPMGASGTAAWIDNHYMQRFGGAVMLSFIQDALQAAANTTQKSSGSGGYTVNNSEQNVETMASKVLDSTINIPPTAHISPGTVMTVIVARDIDFSSVFENR